MKVRDLLEMRPSLQSIIDQKMPSKLSYAIGKNIRKINEELKDFDEARKKILSDNWEYNTEAQKYDIPDEDQDKWQEMYNELLDADAGFEPYTVPLSLTEKVDFTPAEMMALDFMIQNDS